MLSPLLRRYTWNSIWLYNVRIFIALCGTVALPWWLNDVKLTIPLTLGVVAGALADLDDRLAGLQARQLARSQAARVLAHDDLDEAVLRSRSKGIEAGDR